MAVISVNLTDTFNEWRTKTNSLATKQGDLTTLTTTAKSTVVAAINEIDAAGSFANVVEDTSPQLGGNLDVLARSITTSTTNGNIAITPHGSGKVVLDGISFPNADGSNGQVLQTNGSGVLSFASVATDPTMGGDLSGTASNAQLVANCVTGTELAADAIAAVHIADGVIGRSKFVAGTILNDDIGSNAGITGGKLANSTITGTQIAADAIDGTKIADNAINSEHYAAGSVDQTAIGDSQVSTNKIVTGAVVTAKIADDAVNGTKLAANACDSEHYTDGSIDNVHLATGIDAAKLTGTYGSFRSTGIDDNADALAITIDVNEKVGIVTTTPGSYEAEASQLVVGTTSGNNGITIASGTSNTGNIYFADGTTTNQKYRGSISFSHSTEDMSFSTAASTRMTLDNNGNLGIGTASPTEELHVVGDILATGNVTAYSDERLKTNVQELDNTLNAIQNIRGVSYTRTDTKDNSIGVMAQDVETMFPELITESNDGMKSVNYNGLVGVLFSAVKELSATVKQLKERNN